MKFTLIAFLALNALLTILLIGREREPITPGVAAITVVLNGLLIAGTWAWL